MFHDVPEEPWELAGVTVSAAPVAHPGPTLGYRIEWRRASFAYIPDHEPALGVDLARVEDEWIPGFDARGGRRPAAARRAVHRGRVPGTGRVGALERRATRSRSALRAGVGRLVLFHHDPWHADGDLDELEDRARELWNGAGEPPLLAREGMHIDVTA